MPIDALESEDIQDGAPFVPEADLTGQERVAWNVFAGWAGHLIVAIAGFVAPRVMDRQLGQESLGVWDFGWSLVSYFGLTQLGVGSSVSRYVAKHRAAGDVAGLRRVASSVTGLSVAAGSLTLVFTLTCAWLLPRILRADLAAHVGSARWLVLLLGTTVACQLGFQVYQGVLAGCHRFDVLNVITATTEILNSIAIVAVLFAGGGLVALGVVCLAFQLAGDLSRMYWAHRVCPELRVRLADAEWHEAKRLLRFGLKALVYSISGLLLIQANKLTVGGTFGLAALAVFSRPFALIRVIETFAAKFAYVLTPTASSLQSRGQHDQLSRLLLQSTRLGTALALPMVLVLAILGDPIMLLWMGPRYEPGPVVVILALGYLASLALAPMITILFGMNLHGWPALATLVAAGISALLGVLNASVLGWGLTGAALAVAVPLTGSAVFLAAYACRKLELSAGEFLKEALAGPLLCGIPFALILAASRAAFPASPAIAIFGGLALAWPVVLLLYWRFVIPDELKAQIRELPSQLVGLASRYLRGGDASAHGTAR